MCTRQVYWLSCKTQQNPYWNEMREELATWVLVFDLKILLGTISHIIRYCNFSERSSKRMLWLDRRLITKWPISCLFLCKENTLSNAWRHNPILNRQHTKMWRSFTRPAPAFIIPIIFVFDVEVLGTDLVVDFVAAVYFDVRVYYCHHLQETKNDI